jgi:hypothetical protein
MMYSLKSGIIEVPWGDFKEELCPITMHLRYEAIASWLLGVNAQRSIFKQHTTRPKIKAI